MHNMLDQKLVVLILLLVGLNHQQEQAKQQRNQAGVINLKGSAIEENE